MRYLELDVFERMTRAIEKLRLQKGELSRENNFLYARKDELEGSAAELCRSNKALGNELDD